MPARMQDPRLLRSLPHGARVQIRPYSIAQLTACAIFLRTFLCMSPDLTVLAAHAVCLSTLNPFWGL
jgi:hypothetical protein